MDRSLIKRALPYIEALCFAAAWVVGVVVALEQPADPPPAPRERDLVVGDPLRSPAEVSIPQRLYRPIPLEEIQEGG